MGRRQKHPEPFFLLFPWLKTAGLLSLLSFLAIFIYRLSETGGHQSRAACIAAIITSLAAGVCGLYPLGKIWRARVMVALSAILIGSVIRLLIGGVGVAIITFFTQLNKSWYILYVGIYYVLFMIADMGFAVWILAHCDKELKKEKFVHGNMWDIFS